MEGTVGKLTQVAGFCAVMTLLAAGQPTPPAPDLATILKNMERVQAESRARLHAYTVRRRYEVFAQGAGKPGAEVIANVEFLPPATKNFTILQSRGSGTEVRAVRHILENEVQMSRDYHDTALDTSNYDFQLSRAESLAGHRCYVLDAVPRHRTRDLIEGRVWVDSATYRVRRVEGHPAKSPSWWVKDLHVVLDYGEVDGMWLQTASEGDADVRAFGRHRVRERDLSYVTAQTVARSASPAPHPGAARLGPRPYRPAPEAVLGAGIQR